MGVRVKTETGERETGDRRKVTDFGGDGVEV
jgi:hypothetical protein